MKKIELELLYVYKILNMKEKSTKGFLRGGIVVRILIEKKELKQGGLINKNI